MKIKNLKLMPVVGQNASTQIGKMATAINAAAVVVRSFEDDREAEVVALAGDAEGAITQLHSDNTAAFNAKMDADGGSFDTALTDAKAEFTAAANALRDDADASDLDSVADALAKLTAVDAALDQSLIDFASTQAAELDELKAEYGTLAEVTAALA